MKTNRLFLAILKFGPAYELQLALWEGESTKPLPEICDKLKDEFGDHSLVTRGTLPDKVTIYDISRDPVVLDYLDRCQTKAFTCKN